MADIKQIKVGSTTYNIDAVKLGTIAATDWAKQGIHFVEGNVTAGSSDTTDKRYWTGTAQSLLDLGHTAYYDGMTIAFKVGIAGLTTTYLNINGWGDKVCYLRGTTKISTQYPVGTMVTLTYNADQNAFYSSDYDANSYAYVRQYKMDAKTTSYPLMMSYETAIPSSYANKYAGVATGMMVHPKNKTITLTSGTNILTLSPTGGTVSKDSGTTTSPLLTMADLDNILESAEGSFETLQAALEWLDAHQSDWLEHQHKVTAAGTLGGPDNTVKVGSETHTHSTSGIPTSASISVGTGTANYTPAGTVAANSSTVAVSNKDHTHTVTGTAAAQTFTGTSGTTDALNTATSGYTTSVGTATHAHGYDKTTSVTISTGNGTANYTPAGSVPKTSTTAATVASSDHTHNYDKTTSASASYTPAGSVPKTTTTGTTVASSGHKHNYDKTTGVTITPTTETVYSITGVGSLPSWTYTYTESTKTLAFGWSAGSVPTRASKTVMTGASATPTYTATASTAVNSGGTTTVAAQEHTHSFSGIAATITSTLDYTATATNGPSKTANVAAQAHTHGFTGTGVQLVATPSHTSTNSTIPDATVSVASTTHKHGFKPAGTNAVSTISGTAAASSSTTTVASSNHAHGFTGTGAELKVTLTTGNKTSGGPSATTSVGSSSHKHTFTGSQSTTGTPV